MDPATLIASAVIIFILFFTFRYAIICWIRPFDTCRKCQGKRHLPNRIGRGTHDCRRCHATGLRLRIGRHLWNHVRALHRDTTR
ncbi:hypothetical protein [Nonomuraea insulae]|uniref:C2H2-type domain-containing protein n=1 Tax=Nonomuraea insulae TaxID=1616787 RepID=A0ABW1D2Q9_9ACTN